MPGAHRQSPAQRGPAVTMHTDGEGALKNGAAEAILEAKGTASCIRARGQRAAVVEARSGILRKSSHVMDEEL
eukprot:324250-Pyramimonas_sp.AAC.1